MPVLARFYGIVIRMYFLGSEHNPPHISRAAAMVREWIGLHQDALAEMWETQEFRKLDPLD